MIRAILAGRKCQMRRIVNEKILKVIPRYKVRGDMFCASTMVAGGRKVPATMNRLGAVCGKATNGDWLGLKPGEFDFVCPYSDGETTLIDGQWHIKPKDSALWVRETHQLHTTGSDTGGCQYRVTYKAGGRDEYFDPNTEGRIFDDNAWRPSIHMPRWASRITLEVTGIRVERVQEIGSDEYKLDVFQEGICECCDHSPESHESDPMERPWTCGGHGGAGCHIDAIDEFRRLWDSINGKRGCGWDVNPWVWVVEFKKIKP